MFDWTRLEQPVRVKVELDKPLMERRERGKLVQGDENANAIVAEVYQTDGVPYDLTGSTVTLTFVRPDNLAAPPITAEIVGDGNNIAVATLTDTCYRYSGMYAASLKIAKGVVERTIVRILGDVVSTENSGVVDDEVLFPSPEDLLETLAQVETARQNAEAAAARANAGAERVEQLAIDASGLAEDALKLGDKPPEFYLPVQNLLDNSDWRIKNNIINQRGQDSYTANDYFIDRWKSWSVYENFSIIVNDGYIEINNNTDANATIYQRLSKGVLDKDKKYTLAYKTVEGTIEIKNSGVIVYGDNCDTLQIPIYANTSLQLEWAALYEGTYTADTLPPFVPRPYAVELAECQMVAVAYNSLEGSGAIQPNGVAADVSFYLPVPLLDNGKVASIAWGAATNCNLYFGGKKMDVPIDTATVEQVSGNLVTIRVLIPEYQTPNTAVYFRYESNVLISKDL